MNDCNSLKLSNAATKSRFFLVPEEKEAIEAQEKTTKQSSVILRKRLIYDNSSQL